jgi:hypothetical protein
MKVVRIASFLVLLILVANPGPAQPAPHNTYYEYYSDCSFATFVGYDEYYSCDGYHLQGGVTSDYRKRILETCYGWIYINACQHFEGGTWVDIDCPAGV